MLARRTGNAAGPASILVALLLTVVACGSARSDLVAEPEVGTRFFTGDVANLFDPGVLMGVLIGTRTPSRFLYLHTDLSMHPASSDTSSGLERGVAFGLAVGGRFYLGPEAASVRPFLSPEIGFTVLNWSFVDGWVFNPNHPYESQDGFGAFTMGAEGGVTFRATSGMALGLAARYRHHLWTSGAGTIRGEGDPGWGVVGAPGFGGDEFGLNVRLSIPTGGSRASY